MFDIEDLCLGERQSENKVIISYMFSHLMTTVNCFARTEREKTGNRPIVLRCHFCSCFLAWNSIKA